ncbi:glycosyltransferase family 2 protein [Microvirga antarctica]|uniref:glycosyltransferase family 2 protein n=1 Tax=Microvirga antarctica TaxID=2819233 RepID=UPI001B30CBA8|nr:glycosyltransferase family 2 protein [Microvirga antarctica]
MKDDLLRLDTRAISAAAGSHSAFMVVRNEARRLPYCLDYHRALGIERFFIVDNGSDDDTEALLLSQPDCHVFRATGSFAAANYGMSWINALVAAHGVGGWCLFIDADELFTYPHCEKVTLQAFCRFLDRRESEGVFALLLDMYSEGAIADAVYESGKPFLSASPYFDRHYTFRKKFRLRQSDEPLMDTEAVGGPRLRAFYPELGDTSAVQQTLRRVVRRLRRHPLGAAFGLERLRWGAGIAPDLTKIPLIKARQGLSWTSNHRCTPLRLSPMTGALLHFKFFADFHHRARTEAARAQHWDGGAEYARYAALLEAEPRVSLFYDGSEAYRSTRQLIDLGLMRTSPDLDALAECRVNRRRERRLRDQTTEMAPRRTDDASGRIAVRDTVAFKRRGPA